MRSRIWLLGCLIAALAGTAVRAQDEAADGDRTLILPPRIDAADPDAVSRTREERADQPETDDSNALSDEDSGDATGDATNGARLADQPQDREQPLEIVVVIGEPEWRLPDLGSEWRKVQEEERSADRIQLSFVPLYDPENRDPVPDIFERNSGLHRLEMIEVIRVRFGGRSRIRPEEEGDRSP